jgi:hypothetical protein
VREHRTNIGSFDVIASGATPLGERAKGPEIVNVFHEVGATWWLEWLDEQRGTSVQMRERIRQGSQRSNVRWRRLHGDTSTKKDESALG